MRRLDGPRRFCSCGGAGPRQAVAAGGGGAPHVEQARLDGAAQEVRREEVAGLVRHHRPAVLGVEGPRDRLRRQAAQQRAVGQQQRWSQMVNCKICWSTQMRPAPAQKKTEGPAHVTPQNTKNKENTHTTNHDGCKHFNFFICHRHSIIMLHLVL